MKRCFPEAGSACFPGSRWPAYSRRWFAARWRKTAPERTKSVSMRALVRSTSLAAVLLASVLAHAQPSLVLTDGQIIKGNEIKRQGDTYLVVMDDGNTATFPAALVKEIKLVDDPRPTPPPGFDYAPAKTIVGPTKQPSQDPKDQLKALGPPSQWTAEPHRSDVGPGQRLRPRQGRARGEPLDLGEERGRHDLDTEVRVRSVQGRLCRKPFDVGEERGRHDMGAPRWLGVQAVDADDAGLKRSPRPPCRAMRRLLRRLRRSPRPIRGRAPTSCSRRTRCVRLR